MCPIFDKTSSTLPSICHELHNMIAGSEGMITRDGKNRGQSCLPDRSSILCGCAISTLDVVCESIDNGCITIKELGSISKKIDQMEKLCSAAKTGSLEKKGEEYNRFMITLDTRLRECKAFFTRQELLGNLCKGIPVDVAGT